MTNKERSVICIVILGVALLIANYIYTFQGFVAFTSEERIAGKILRNIETSFDNKEAKNDYFNKLPKDTKEIVAKHITIYRLGKNRYKSIQQFYFEELIISFACFIILFITLKLGAKKANVS